MVMMNCTYCCRLFESFVCLCGGRKSFDGSEGHCFVLWQVILFPVKYTLHVVLYCSVTHCSVLHCCMLFFPLYYTLLLFYSACTSASLEPSYVLRAVGADEDLAHSSIRYETKYHHLLQLSLCINCICNYIM